MTIKVLRYLFLIIFILLVSKSVFASDYKIETSTINEAGEQSSGASLKVWHNFGEPVAGISESSSYRVYSGFWQPDEPALCFSVTPSEVDFGVLSYDKVSEKSVVLNITSNITNGFNVQAYDNTDAGTDNGLTDGLNKIKDATGPNIFTKIPIAGNEFYGIVATGAHASDGYANGTKINSLNNSTLTDVGGYGSVVFGDDIKVKFMASIASDTAASNKYSSTVHFLVTSKY